MQRQFWKQNFKKLIALKKKKKKKTGQEIPLGGRRNKTNKNPQGWGFDPGRCPGG